MNSMQTAAALPVRLDTSMAHETESLASVLFDPLTNSVVVQLLPSSVNAASGNSVPQSAVAAPQTAVVANTQDTAGEEDDLDGLFFNEM